MGQQVITTVLTPAASYALVSLSDVKDDWAITGTDSDTFLTRSIARASAAAAQFCNRVFPSETVKDDFTVDRDPYPYQVPGGVAPLQLTRWPVSSVTSVVEGVGSQEQTLDPATDYRLDAVTGQMLRIGKDGNPMFWPATRVVVTYVGGFSTIPQDLQDAVSRMVWVRYAERGRDPFVESVRVEGVETIKYIVPGADGNLSPDIADILENYRVPVAL